MTIDAEFLEKLICPRSRKPLRLAESAELERVNAEIRAGRAENLDGEVISEAVEAGLVPEGERIIYPVRNDIPVLLAGEAIRIDP